MVAFAEELLAGLESLDSTLALVIHATTCEATGALAWCTVDFDAIVTLPDTTSHRASHRVALLWAIHEVHHQPRECNLGTAQRLSWLEAVPNIPFVLGLAVLGVPLSMAVACFTLKIAYSLFTHTRLVSRLGPVERCMVTPSHHRVHHASNAAYLDRNYGSMLIIWDRLFGTFAEEVEEPRFGTLHARDIDDAWTSNVGPFRDLFARARTAPTVLGALETLIRPPGWNPTTRREEVLAVPAPQPEDWRARDRVAMGLGFALALGGLLVGVELAECMAPVTRIAVGATLVAGVIAVCSKHVPSPWSAT